MTITLGFGTHFEQLNLQDIQASHSLSTITFTKRIAIGKCDFPIFMRQARNKPRLITLGELNGYSLKSQGQTSSPLAHKVLVSSVLTNVHVVPQGKYSGYTGTTSAAICIAIPRTPLGYTSPCPCNPFCSVEHWQYLLAKG